MTMIGKTSTSRRVISARGGLAAIQKQIIDIYQQLSEMNFDEDDERDDAAGDAMNTLDGVSALLDDVMGDLQSAVTVLEDADV